MKDGEIRKQILVSTPHIYTKQCTDADTQYSLQVPAGTKYFNVQHRGDTATIRLAYEDGKVAGPTEPYATIKPGASHESPPLELKEALIIYLASDEAGIDVEVCAWE